MRHRKKFNHLGRKSAHRQETLSSMATALILHKRINTTLAKAKALRVYVEPLITKSKIDSTHSRRTVFSYLGDKNAVSELFREVAQKVADRPGGYTRILKTGFRKGDSAEMCFIELVDYNANMLSTDEETKQKTTRRGGRRRKSSAADTTKTNDAPAATTTDQEAPVDEAATVDGEASVKDDAAAEAGGAEKETTATENVEDSTSEPAEGTASEAVKAKDTESKEEPVAKKEAEGSDTSKSEENPESKEQAKDSADDEKKK